MPPQRPVPGPLFAVLPLVIVLLAVLNLKIPYLLLLPGPVEETKALVSISGAEVFPSEGRLYLTTITLGPSDRRLLVADYLRAKLERSWEVVPFEIFYPPQLTPEQVDESNKADIEDSKITAKAAALRYLGYGVDISGAGALVTQVREGFPAVGVMREGDLISAISGRTVCRPVDLVQSLAERRPGDTVRLTVWRDGRAEEIDVETVANDDGLPVTGVTVEAAPVRAGLTIEIDSRDIGGPSAGLMFALAITDLLESENLPGGRSIAGTGTISCDGRVGAVGGLQQKIASAEREDADLFIVPAAELGIACQIGGKVPIVGVRTLDEAVTVLRDPAGARARSCSALEARG